MVEETTLSTVLVEFADTLVTDFPVQGILDHLVRRIIEILPVTSAGVTLIALDQKPRYIAASDDNALRYESLQSELGEGPCVVAYETGEAVAISDLVNDSQFTRFGPMAVSAGLGAVFTFPLHRDESRLGALDLYRESPGPLSDAEMATAQTLANVAATYVTTVQSRADAHAAADFFRQTASHDSLTGLPNRSLLAQRLEHACQRGERSHTKMAVLFADLDRFKHINDSHGHLVGDQVLIAVARRLTSLLRPGDTLARVSGDEFVILCEDMQDAAYVEVLANRINRAFALPFLIGRRRINLTASIGIAFAGEGKDMPHQLMRDADSAMYQAKARGGAGHQVLDLREETQTNDWQELERDLSEAITKRRLEVHYQPVVNSADGAMTGVEALIRWKHPARGHIPAQTVIALAEESGLINELGFWVLERACRDQQRWLSKHPHAPLTMAVNVSTTQLMRNGFCNTVSTILKRTGAAPAGLVLEMTEDILIEDGGRAADVLSGLHALGVSLSLDDFGTGYSSLSYLRGFPVDQIKIDQAFVADLGIDPGRRGDTDRDYRPRRHPEARCHRRGGRDPAATR